MMRLRLLMVGLGPHLYNIVLWRDRYYGLPRRLGQVNLESADLSTLDGVLEAASLEDIRSLIRSALPVGNAGPPVLVEAYRQHNVVFWKGSYHALPFNLGPVDLEHANLSSLEGVVTADSIGTLRELLDVLPEAVSTEPQLMEVYGSYNIVLWQGRYYSLPKTLGEIDLTRVDVSTLLGVLQADSLDSLKLKIQQRLWSF